MAQAIHNPIRRPSMCESPPIAQLATALGDLQSDFRYLEALSDFLQEETFRGDHHRRPELKVFLMVQALENRISRFKLNLDAVAELAQEAR